MNAIDVQADSGYNQHFFVETHSETDTASVVTVVGQHKGGLVADSLTWGQPGSAQYFQRYKQGREFRVSPSSKQQYGAIAPMLR